MLLQIKNVVDLLLNLDTNINEKDINGKIILIKFIHQNKKIIKMYIFAKFSR